MPMNALLERLSKLSSAEEFLAYFDIPFDEAVVHVNRLHILKRFYQYLQQHKRLGDLDAQQMHDCYRGLLQRSYQDFVRSTPAQEKVFKVFQDAQAKSFSLEKLRQTLPSRS